MIGLLFHESYSVSININNIRNNKGHIRLSVFTSEESFENRKPIMKKSYRKHNIQNNKLKATVHLKSGIYGISILDDEDDDKKMKYNFLGMPTEGFGFAAYYHSSMKKPKFDDFKFLIEDKPLNFSSKMRYL